MTSLYIIIYKIILSYIYIISKMNDAKDEIEKNVMMITL